MCDNDSINDIIEYKLRTGGLSRRQFGALTLGVGVASALPLLWLAEPGRVADGRSSHSKGTVK